MKRQDTRWGDAHVKLKRLFDQRAGITQQEFAEKYGLGTQGMVWQYLSGYRPLNYEAAAKFAKGLKCRIDDFCPEMAEELRKEIVPVLGKVMRRAAMVLLPSMALSSVAPEQLFNNNLIAPPYVAKSLSLIHIVCDLLKLVCWHTKRALISSRYLSLAPAYS